MSLPLVNCNDCCQDCPPTNLINLIPCINGEPCEEVVPADCTKFIGPNLPALGILNGDRLSTVLTKLHKVVNSLLVTPITLIIHTATSTTTTPLVVRYLALGPIYNSPIGATSVNTTVTVGSTTGLVVGMTLEVIAGVGVFASGTTVTNVINTTTFSISQAASTALSGGATIIRATGTAHTAYSISVIQGTPQTFKAFVGSTVIVSGTGTVV